MVKTERWSYLPDVPLPPPPHLTGDRYMEVVGATSGEDWGVKHVHRTVVTDDGNEPRRNLRRYAESGLG